YACKNMNEVCIPESDICRDNGLCVMTTDGINKCTPIPGNGGDCSLTNLCLDSYMCDKTTKTCVSQQYLGFGEPCTNTTQCSSGLTCQGTCTSSTYPNCQTDVQCKYFERCNNNFTCADPLPYRSACQKDSDCSLNGSCLKNVCVALFSVPAGGFCDENEDCDISQNLLCISNTCQNKNIVNNVRCNSTGDCFDINFPSLCQCDPSAAPYFGRCFQTYNPTSLSKNTYSDFNQCLMNNKCPKVDRNIPTSCSASKCGYPFNKAYSIPCYTGSGSALFRNGFLTILFSLLSGAILI
ncbi:hypothetical protein SAMD00019534_066310, partial [Acytostelium subglobosum LB1]|uniref:hypothetical protein n=1 Tax=Acytostelium subglobosum LB1 TaxID=1410327 RepID=UPI000644AFA2